MIFILLEIVIIFIVCSLGFCSLYIARVDLVLVLINKFNNKLCVFYI